MGADEQGAGLWSEIVDSRFADGNLWTSNLSLDHHGRHMALIGWMSEMEIPLTTGTSIGVISRDIRVFYPDSWDIDTTFQEVKLVLQISINSTIVSGSGAGDYSLVGGSNEHSNAGAPKSVWLTKEYLKGALPTGETVETVQMDITGISGEIGFFRGKDGTSPADGITCGWLLLPLTADV